MILDILDRIILLTILNNSDIRTNYETHELLGKLKEDLNFSEKENEEYEIRPIGERVGWNPQKAQTKLINIHKDCFKVIADLLIDLNEEKNLSLDSVSLYKKFVIKEKKKIN